MSEPPAGEADPLQTRLQALSVLEKALREALAVVPLEYVVQQVTVMFPKTPVEIDTGPGSGFHGRVQKVSVSMPEELTAAIRERTGPGGFSRFVSEAAERRLKSEVLRELLDELYAEAGPVPAGLREQARREWPDYEEE
jgi:Arc/MetJ-type ribon-helix-helix transcriptional regulator